MCPQAGSEILYFSKLTNAKKEEAMWHRYVVTKVLKGNKQGYTHDAYLHGKTAREKCAATMCCTVLCCAVLCHVVLCCAVLCYTLPPHTHT